MYIADSSDRDERLDEILAGYLRAAELGEAPDAGALLACNPDLAPELAAFFANEKRIDRLASPLRQLHRNMAAASPGQIIGNYEIIEEIAHGGMGVVYRARQRNVSRIVALKMLRSGPIASPSERHRFRIEAEAFARLDHPHIVPIFEVGEQGDQLFFTMRLMEGGSLAQHIDRFRRDPRVAARMLAEVADAVHYAHQRGFLHRDLKPGNILLDAEGRPHVSDFGLAKRLETVPGGSVSEVTQTGMILGTPSYMAPEQAGGTKDGISTVADVYSLGAILYELLAGRPPFRAETPIATLLQAREHDPESLSRLRPGIDRDIETIALKCLEKDPRKRYASAADLAEELRRYADGKPIVARPLGPIESFTRWCRRRPLVAALAASFVIGFGLVTWQWQRAERHAQRADANALQAEANADQAEANAEQARANAKQAEANAAIAEGHAAAARENARRAEENAQAEKESRARAERDFARAHNAVNKFSTTFSERDLMNLPGHQDIRKDLLEDALRYYQEFLKEHAGDPQLVRELAEAQVRVARIRDAVGSRTEALTAYLEARGVYEKIATANPRDREARRKLASAAMHVGLVRIATGQTDEGMRDYLTARDLYRAILKEDATDSDAMGGLSTTLDNVSIRLLDTGKTAEARTALEEARQLRDSLVAKFPKSLNHKNRLAGIYNSFGRLLELERRPPSEGRDFYRKALALREEAVDSYPYDPGYQRDLAEIHHNLGVTEDRLKNKTASKEHFKKAFEIHDRLVRDNPKVNQYQRDLAGSLVNLGLAHLYDNEAEKSMPRFQKARELQEKLVEGNPNVPGYRRDLARSWFQIGVAAERLGRVGESIPNYERSRDILVALIHDDPASLGARDRLAQTLNNLGLNLAKTGKADEGRQALRRAIEEARFILERRPNAPKGRSGLGNYLSSLAEVERGAGKWEAALALTLEHRKVCAGDGEELFRAGCDLARMAALVKDDKDRYAQLAVETLRQARDARLQDFSIRVRDNKALDVLRARLDFKELLDSKPG
jgi:serine/threonine-protein kinase